MENILYMVARMARQFLESHNLLLEDQEIVWNTEISSDEAEYIFVYQGSNLGERPGFLQIKNTSEADNSKGHIVLVIVTETGATLTDLRPARILNTTGGSYKFHPDEEVVFDEAHRI